jgi:hypothetical protein
MGGSGQACSLVSIKPGRRQKTPTNAHWIEEEDLRKQKMSGTRLCALLGELGYEGAETLDPDSFEWPFQYDDARPILDWICSSLRSSNVLSLSDLSRLLLLTPLLFSFLFLFLHIRSNFVFQSILQVRTVSSRGEAFGGAIPFPLYVFLFLKMICVIRVGFWLGWGLGVCLW